MIEILIKIFHKTKKVFSYSPITLRGYLSLVVCFFCLNYLGQKNSDLLGSILGISLLIIFTIFFLILLSFSSKMRKSLKVSSQDKNIEIFSKRENKTGLIVNQISIPPFFYLSIKRVFNNNNVIHAKHIMPSSKETKNSQNILQDIIKFPNRGIYKMSGYEVSFSDIMGLTKKTWLINHTDNYNVFSPIYEISNLPIMAASSQIGDNEQSNDNKNGDLFNIRAYQPGDSLKRILWKVYARTSHLVVREPEPAIIPEGEVSIYVFAQEKEDSVVSSALSYLRILERQNIIYSIGFLGSEKISFNYENALLNSIEYNLVQSNSFTNFLDKLKLSNRTPYSVIVFLSESIINGEENEELNAKELARSKNQLDSIIKEADQLNIKIHLVSTPNISNLNKDTKDKKAFKNSLLKNKLTTSNAKNINSTLKLNEPPIKVQIENIA